MKRPGAPMHFATTPSSEVVIGLLGGVIDGSVALTRHEMNKLNKLYGLVPEKAQEKPPPPKAPVEADFKSRFEYQVAFNEHKRALERHANWQDPRPFLQAGADRNVLRHAREDGLRMVAWLARHCPPGSDPMKTLLQIAINAGLDVDPADVDWAQEDFEVNDEESVA